MRFYKVNNLRSFTKVENSGSSRIIRRSNSRLSSILESRQSACKIILERPSTNKFSEQEATVTLAPARLSKSIGTVASISSNPLASKTKTEFSTTEIKNESLNLTSYQKQIDFFYYFLLSQRCLFCRLNFCFLKILKNQMILQHLSSLFFLFRS